MNLTIGSKVVDDKNNSYILEEFIDDGGYGVVYKARRESDGFVVAVKTFIPTFNSKETLLTFQKEILQTKHVNSKNVIKYFYFHDGEENPQFPPYIIMEYANEGTLNEFIKKQKEKAVLFDLKTILNIYSQLCEGMKEISKFLVHRDIKPKNILILDGKLKISDFGLSKLSSENTKTLTFKGFGTSRYACPEVWNNDENTIQMDIYSMGIVFYEIATLNYPYVMKENAVQEDYREAHLYKTIENPLNFNNQLPPNVVSIIIKMLEKSTYKRYKNWDEIIAALELVNNDNSDFGKIVSGAVSKRNNEDLRLQDEETKKNLIKKEKEELCKRIYYQYQNDIYNNIENFVELFNAQYQGNKKFSCREISKNLIIGKFSYCITTPSSEAINITTEIIEFQTFTRTIPKDRVFMDEGNITVSYTPQCRGKDILAWSQVVDDIGNGFNLLLLKGEDNLYGEWFILNNSPSPIYNNSNRKSKFGFSLQELPNEINKIDVMHIYNSSLSKLDIKEVIKFIANHV